MLRDYQKDVYDRTREAFREGYKAPLVVLPCRSGKSYVMKAMTEAANKKENHVLILAHRLSLIRQHKELFSDIDWNLTRIESVFTEVRHLGENGPVDLIIIDEAHLASASSYMKVCQYYNCPIVGYTGSPARLDGKPLSLFDKLIIGISADELIKRGKISSYSYYAPDLNIDFSSVKKTAGDYNNLQLGKVMNSKKIYGDILKYYKLLANGKNAIAYCTNVAHSKEVCKLFNDNNISAKHIDATTPEEEREEILNDFEQGKFKILCNCNLISEGITLPSAEVCLMLRKTASLPLFIQQGCRALTPVEGKTAIIIDYVNNIQNFGFPTSKRFWSLDSKVKEYDNENDDGTLKIRICQECFRTFLTAPVCPYCGAEYKSTEQEIQNFREIELKKVEEERQAKKQKYLDEMAEKVKNYKSINECKTWTEMTEYAKKMGFKPGYAYIMAKKKGIYIPKGG